MILNLHHEIMSSLDTPVQNQRRVCYPIRTLRKLDIHRFLSNKEDKLN
jgi:hypothetical protein